MGVRITVQSLWSGGERSSFVYEFAQPRIVIGRSRSSDVQLPHAAVSGTHATIREQGPGYVVVDEGSTNGTRLNEGLLAAGRAKPLRPDDVVDLGGYRLAIEVGVPVATTMSARLTTELARRMLGEQCSPGTPIDLDAELAAVQRGTDQVIELLPLPEESPSTPATRESRPSRPRPSRPESQPEAPTKLGRGALAVYALAGLVVVTSLIAMAMLAQP
jgi:hypothetical protein